jgi:hypothetical protein
VTEPEPTAEWEPDEPDTAMDAPADTTPTNQQPATQPTQPNPPHPGMQWDADANKWIETEPRNREQRYRQQLRAAEAERDQLRERLERRDRAEVEHLVAARLIDPQDLWHVVTLADVLDPESGEISPQLVDEAVTRVVKEQPHWRFNPAAPASQVTSPHAGITEEQQQPTWQQLFQQATRPA